MPRYSRFISPLVPIGATTAVSVFNSLMAARLHNKQAALDDREDGGGSVAANKLAA